MFLVVVPLFFLWGGDSPKILAIRPIPENMRFMIQLNMGSMDEIRTIDSIEYDYVYIYIYIIYLFFFGNIDIIM